MYFVLVTWIFRSMYLLLSASVCVCMGIRPYSKIIFEQQRKIKLEFKISNKSIYLVSVRETLHQSQMLLPPPRHIT